MDELATTPKHLESEVLSAVKALSPACPFDETLPVDIVSNMKPADKKHFLALDALRGFAAVYVFLYHAKVIPLFGQETVILFFVLSGFLIYHTTHSGNRPSAWVYLGHRARRIYPIFLVALFAAYVSACIIAQQLQPANWFNLLENIFMLQGLVGWMGDLWAPAYWGNSPLWSLSFEWWFYMLFIPLCLVSSADRKVQFARVAAISLFGLALYNVYPHPAALICNYLAIWWLGVELAREYLETQTVTVQRQIPSIILIGVSAAVWGALAIFKLYGSEPVKFGAEPFLQARQFGAAILFIVLGFAWKLAKFRAFGLVFGPFALLASSSYAIYVIHYPVLLALKALLPTYSAPAQAAIAMLLLLPPCYWLEVKVQRRIVFWLGRLTGTG